jgi:hypothetical protein
MEGGFPMKIMLQVFDGDNWAILNTRHASEQTEKELREMQSAWSANYDRFKESNVKFRIVRE